MVGVIDAIKKLDFFPKANAEFRVKTTSGAIVSIISVVLMVMLFLSEISYYMKTEVVDHLYVNSTRSEKLKVNFDFSFPQISCDLLAVDAIDEAGVPQKDIVHSIYKHRLSPNGAKEGDVIRHERLGDSLMSEKDIEKLSNKNSTTQEGSGCGNCYGAGDEGECCNTCEEVQQAYARKGWHFKPAGIPQCAGVDAKKSERGGNAGTEGGCQIYGQLELSTVSGGHFHIAPHKKLHGGDGDGVPTNLASLLDMIFFTFDQFNVSHRINTLSFGDHFPGIRSPLDGAYRQLEDKHGMYQYYIKVVPTIYRGLGKPEIHSNQYSVTEHMRHLSPGSGMGLPGLYFFYELSPVQAVFEQKRVRSFASFATSLCAIVGGAFSVMGVVDRIVAQVIKYVDGSGLIR